MTVNVGIIGSGGIVKKAHLPSFSQDGRVNIMAIASRNPKRLKELSTDFKIPCKYISWEEMIKNDDIQAVSIATVNNYHCNITLSALERGKHVLIEKPMAVNKDEVEKIIETSEKTGKFVMVQQTLRFNPVINALKTIIQEERIGKITKINLIHGHNGPKSDWYYDIELSGGGVLLDLGIHAVDTLRYLFPDKEIEDINASLFKLKSNIDDFAMLSFKIKPDLEGGIVLSWIQNPAMGIIGMLGQNGKIFSVFWPREKQGLTINDTNFNDFSKEEEYGSKPFKHFIDSIESGKEPMCSCRDNALSMRLIFEAYENSTVF